MTMIKVEGKLRNEEYNVDLEKIITTVMENTEITDGSKNRFMRTVEAGNPMRIVSKAQATIGRIIGITGIFEFAEEFSVKEGDDVSEEATEEPKEREEDETEEPTEEETTMTEFTNQDRFFEVHSEQCENNCWNQISDQYSQVCCECPECGAKYWEAGERFDGDANPQYDDDGRKIGSGEYVEEPFFGVIRD